MAFVALRLRCAEFFHTHTHTQRAWQPFSVRLYLCGPKPSVCARRVVRCLKEKETVSDEFCWHLSNGVSVFVPHSHFILGWLGRVCCWASFFKSDFALTACLLQAARSSILTGFVVQTCIEHFHPSSPSWNLSLYANFLEVNQDNGLLRNQPTAITWVRCFQFQSGLCFTNLFQAATFEKNPQSRAHVPIFAESFLLQNHFLTGNWLSCRLNLLHGPHFESNMITMDHRTIVKNQLWNQIQDVDPCLDTEEARGALHVSHLPLASPSCWLHFSIIFWSLQDDLHSMKKPCWMSMDSDLCSTQIPHPIHLSGESEGSTQMFSFNPVTV